MATTKTRKARRLAPAARRDQLADAAMAVIARQGFAEFSLDAVAQRAGVTRNLLYHYFPRGRLDLFLAALDRAGSELTHRGVGPFGRPRRLRCSQEEGQAQEEQERSGSPQRVFSSPDAGGTSIICTPTRNSG